MPDWRKCWTDCLRAAWHSTLRSLNSPRDSSITWAKPLMPAEVKTILDMKEPDSMPAIRWLLGILMKFVPNLAEKSKPLKDLLQKDVSWSWGKDQQNTFSSLKMDLASPETLALYSLEQETVDSADSSSYGLKAVFLQQQENSKLQPVAYASWSQTETEQCYSQIKKEALAIMWSLERRSDLLISMSFRVKTDHKPLVPLFSSKLINKLLSGFSAPECIVHIPGKELYTADALSTAPLATLKTSDNDLTCLAEAYINAVLLTLPASDRRLEEIRSALKKDDTLRVVMHHVQNGWPDKRTMNSPVKTYFNKQGNLSVCHDGLLLWWKRLIVPPSLIDETFSNTSMMDIKESTRRTMQQNWYGAWDFDMTSTRWWRPVLSAPHTGRPEQSWWRESHFLINPGQELLLTSSTTNGKLFLLAIDYSTTWETLKLSLSPIRLPQPEWRSSVAMELQTWLWQTMALIVQLKNLLIHTALGIWLCDIFTTLPPSKWQIEHTVLVIKNLMKNSNNEYFGLLMYRNTPLHNAFSPAQLSMGRMLKTRAPCHLDKLLPKVPDITTMNKQGLQEEDKGELKQKTSSLCSRTTVTRWQGTDSWAEERGKNCPESRGPKIHPHDLWWRPAQKKPTDAKETEPAISSS